jgi:hypothetical protein
MAGDRQPRKRQENHRGYGNLGWDDAGLDINVVSELPKFVPTPKPAIASATVAVVDKTPIKLSANAKQGKGI